MYGADDQQYSRAQNDVRIVLNSLGARTDALIIEGEKRVISQQINEVRVLAVIASYLIDNIGNRRLPASLPMTYEQAVLFAEVMRQYQEKLALRAAPKSSRTDGAIRWLIRQNSSMQSNFSEEQWPLYLAITENLNNRRSRLGVTLRDSAKPRPRQETSP